MLVVRDVKTQLAEGFVIAGDPQRCVDTIQKWREEVGLTAISGTFHFGGMPQEMAIKNIRLFAESVMPQLKVKFTTTAARVTESILFPVPTPRSPHRCGVESGNYRAGRYEKSKT